MRTKTLNCCCLLVLCASSLLADDSAVTVNDGPLFALGGETMGTTYTVKVWPVRSLKKQIWLRNSINEELAEINALMSTYLPNSEVSRFNQAGANEWFDVSKKTAHVVDLAQETSRSTEGAFDITVGPLVELWKFGPAAADRSTGEVQLPTQTEIDATLRRVGYTKLEVRRNPPALRKTVADLEIDLSAIAKGYAVDRVCDVVRDYGISNFMVEFGGEVRVAGKKPNGDPWTIAIESPLIGVRQQELVLSPVDIAIASSGDYRNFFEHAGVLYSHTIDPRTGWPVTHSLSGTTVAAERCAVADAQATALMVLGHDDGLVWADDHDVAAILMTRTDDTVQRQLTSAFDVPVYTPPKRKNELAKTIIIAAVVFAVVILAMSVGVIVKGRRLKGSCGGLAGMKDNKGRTICDACTSPSPECTGEARELASAECEE